MAKIKQIICISLVLLFFDVQAQKIIVGAERTDSYLTDLKDKKDQILNDDKKNLLSKIRIYFQKINYPIDYNELIKLNLDQLISTTSMISPFTTEEKQKLIETVNINDKIKILDEIISFNLADFQENKTVQ